jgi:hypothetical protein
MRATVEQLNDVIIPNINSQLETNTNQLADNANLIKELSIIPRQRYSNENDDTLRLQEAIDYARAYGKGKVKINGTYIISKITLPSYVILEGSGCGTYGTIIKSIANNTNNCLIEIKGEYSSIRDIYVHGNLDNNTNEIDGIKITAGNSQELTRVVVRYCTGSGLSLEGGNDK